MNKSWGVYILFYSFAVLGCKDSLQNFNTEFTKLFSAQSTKVSTVYGRTSGYGNLRRDGVADFGLVLKAFKKSDLFQIELNDLMSTKFDSITIIGNDIEIPSNVALPKQQERYILTINIDKPDYQIEFQDNEITSLVLLHGQFPFEDVVKGFRNDLPLLKLADKFNILSFSEYNIDNSSLQRSIELNLVAGKNTHNNQAKISSPAIFSSDYSFVVVALDQKNNFMLANNLTILTPNKTKTMEVTGLNTQIFSGLIHESFADSSSTSILKHKMSFQLNDMKSWTSDLLGFIENIKVSSGVASFSLPANKGLNELGLVYNIVEVQTSGQESVLMQEALIGPWSSNIDFSQLQFSKKQNHKYRLDIFLCASKKLARPADTDELFELSDFVTRNSVYF